MQIKEIMESTGLSVHTLRYYEKIGLIQYIARDKHGTRMYTEKDLEWIKFLIKLKITRMPLEELKKYAESYYANEDDKSERFEMLREHKKRMIKELEEIQETIKYIDKKLNKCNS